MFGTMDEPGLIPQCLHRIFLNVGSNIDEKVLFKPIGLENLIPTVDSDLNIEIATRNYIFKDEKVTISFLFVQFRIFCCMPFYFSSVGIVCQR